MLEQQKNYIIKIEGMGCQHCVDRITHALQELKEVSEVDVLLDLKEAHVTSKSPIEKEKLKTVIEDLGYEVIEILE